MEAEPSFHNRHLQAEVEVIRLDALTQVNDPRRLADLVAEYRTRFGRIVDTDKARELFPAYADADRKDRARVTAAVHEPAARIAREVWNELLREHPQTTREAYVFILAGGSGSGKGTLLQKFLDQYEQSRTFPHAIYDTTLSNYNGAKSLIEEALSADLDVDIRYIHRPVENALQGIREREEVTGRNVPLDILALTHFNAQQSIIRLSEEYQNHTRVAIKIFDNTGLRNEFSGGSLEETILPRKYLSQDDVIHRIQQENKYEQRASLEQRQPLQSIGERTERNAATEERLAYRGLDQEPQRGSREESSRAATDPRSESIGGRDQTRVDPQNVSDDVSMLNVSWDSADQNAQPELIGHFAQRSTESIIDNERVSYTVQPGSYAVVGVLSQDRQSIQDAGIIFQAQEAVTGQPQTVVQFHSGDRILELTKSGKISLEPRIASELTASPDIKASHATDDHRRLGMRR